jgi:hypothetical protein
MSVPIMLIAIFSGLVGSAIWLLSGGSFWLAIGVYVLTGQLVSLAIVVQLFRQPED